MKTRMLGQLKVAELGFGCMGMSEFYGDTKDTDSLTVLERAFEVGFDHFDTSDMYGQGHNEQLLSKFLEGKKGRVKVATKFGIVRESGARRVDNSRSYIQSACEASLRRLGVETIDLYYVHRLDRSRPIEETVADLAQLVRAGKVRFLGLSEVSPEELRRAHGVHPITAIQSEYSLASRTPEVNGLFATCEELKVGFVAYSPLCRGLLSGAIRSARDLAENDARRSMPRFAAENIEKNINLVRELTECAAKNGCTPAQMALAWILNKKPFITPLLGVKSLARLEENRHAEKIEVPGTIAKRLEEIFEVGSVSGDRYTKAGMNEVYES